MITIFYNPFRSAWKLGMWTRFRAIVERMFSTSTAPALLIGNYRLGEVDWDAILVAGKEVFLFEFKTQVTRSIIITNKKWLDENGHKIFPGSRQETPFFQLRDKRNILRGAIRGNGIDEIHAIVLFPEDFKLLDISTKPDLKTRPWFKILSMSEVADMVRDSINHPSDNDEDMQNEMTNYFLQHNSQYLIRQTSNIFNINHRGVLNFDAATTSQSA